MHIENSISENEDQPNRQTLPELQNNHNNNQDGGLPV